MLPSQTEPTIYISYNSYRNWGILKNQHRGLIRWWRAYHNIVVEVFGESANKVNEVSVVGNEALEVLQLQVLLGDRVLHALGCFLRVLH